MTAYGKMHQGINWAVERKRESQKNRKTFQRCVPFPSSGYHPLKRRFFPARVQGVIFPEAVIFLLAAVRPEISVRIFTVFMPKFVAVKIMYLPNM
jgi:hypothetical protein